MFEESKDNEDKYIEKDKDKKDSHDGKSFKVVDKRLFSKDGMNTINESESAHSNIHEEKNIESEKIRTELHDNTKSEIIGDNDKSEISAIDNNANNMDELKADFSTFVYSLNAQALFYLGKLPNPMTGKYEKDLKTARYLIDTIDMLFNKTKGNLDENESKLITNIMYDLKMFYVNEK
ncbi:MAG: DUF1844 domain-containing protein [bacterium]